MTDIRDHIIDAATKAVMADSDRAKPQLARLLFYTWGMLPVSYRKRFLDRVMFAEPYDLFEWEKRWPDLKDPLLEEAARNWGYVESMLRAGGQSKEYDFARSISKLLRQRRKPSAKQIKWMKELFRDWQAWKREPDAGVNVTEDPGAGD